MKIIDRMILVIFSIIIFTLSVISMLVLFGVMETSTIMYAINAVKSNEGVFRVVIAILIILILCAIKAILTKEENEEGIIVENANGKLLITKDSLENLINTTAKEFDAVDNVSSKIILDKDKNLRAFLFLSLTKNVIIKDLSVELQNSVKQCLKETMDLETKEVSIKIKSISKSKNTSSKKTAEISKRVPQEEKKVAEKNEEA